MSHFFNFPLCLAPMVGLSHVVLRQIIREYTPAAISLIGPTEMLNSRKIPHEKLGATAETLIYPNEKNLVPQILGNDEKAIQQTIAKMLNEWSTDSDLIAGIDINMGCPVQKALRHNYGVALMGDVGYAARVVEYAVKASSRPVSVKLRAVGSDKSVSELIQFVTTLKNAGAQWVTLHPRTAEQKRKGQADWSQIKELKQALDIPIFGNGDIQYYTDVFAMKEQTNCDVVMAGRAFAARPWMAWQVAYHQQQEKLKSNSLAKPYEGTQCDKVFSENQLLNESSGSLILKPPLSETDEASEYGRMLLKFINLSEHYFKDQLGYSEDYVFRKIQFFVKVTHVWLEFGHSLTAVVSQAKSLEQLKDKVQNFFAASEHRMVKYTELRQ